MRTSPKGGQGPPGPAGPPALHARGTSGRPMGGAGAPGSAEPAGARGPSGAASRLLEHECRGPCTVSREANEKVVNAYATNLAGAFTYDADGRANFPAHQRAMFLLPSAMLRVLIAASTWRSSTQGALESHNLV